MDGQVGFHRPENVRRMSVEKNNPIVKAIDKTRVERHPDLAQEQQDRLNEIQREKKELHKKLAKEEQAQKLKQKQEKEEQSYDRIMKSENMTSASEMKATEDATAAEEFEDDFF